MLSTSTWLLLLLLLLLCCMSAAQGTPDAPQCGFSNMACRILDAYSEFVGTCRLMDVTAVIIELPRLASGTWPAGCRTHNH
jgi:glutaredoxin-related protein